MSFELDHLFVLATVGAPEADRLSSLGLAEGSRNVHPGQGTANRRFFFHDAMLELLWVRDEHEARSAVIAPTGLWERSNFRQNGASPFGICLRATDAASSLPFETWSYRPPYLPAGVEIPVARAASLAEPMVFSIPFGGRPDTFPPERREPIEHPLGIRELREVRITLTEGTVLAPSLRALEALGIARFVHGSEPLMELSFEGARTGGTLDLRPELPLVLRW